MTMIRAAVLVQPGAFEMREFPRPPVGDDDGLLRLEACGVCGTDYEIYAGEMTRSYGGSAPYRFPMILGHEPVGIIEEIGPAAAKRWGVARGDRVVVRNWRQCARCPSCLAGKPERCTNLGGLGLTAIDVAPAVWGAYATHMYLPPAARVFPISPRVTARAASTFNALACGFEWSVFLPQLKPGQHIAILGPGQRGLASVLAARSSGAGKVIVTGLTADQHKLDLALSLGADLAINVERDDPVALVRELTGGGADVVVDTTPVAVQPVQQALDMVRRGGTVILAGIKGATRTFPFASDTIIEKALTVKGAYGASDEAVRSAIRLIESDAYPADRLVTDVFTIDQAKQAVESLGRHTRGKGTINVAIVPK